MTTEINKTMNKFIKELNKAQEKAQKPFSEQEMKNLYKNQKPKKTSAYLNFSKEMRTVIKEKNPNDDFIAISKKLGAMWQSLSTKEKQKYNSVDESTPCSYIFTKGKKIGSQCNASSSSGNFCSKHKKHESRDQKKIKKKLPKIKDEEKVEVEVKEIEEIEDDEDDLESE